MESGKNMNKEIHTIEFNSFEELLDFLEWLKNDEPQVCLTKTQLHEACDDAWTAWAAEKERTKDNKIAVAQFVRVLTGKLFGDDKAEKEEN